MASRRIATARNRAVEKLIDLPTPASLKPMISLLLVRLSSSDKIGARSACSTSAPTAICTTLASVNQPKRADIQQSAVHGDCRSVRRADTPALKSYHRPARAGCDTNSSVVPSALQFSSTDHHSNRVLNSIGGGHSYKYSTCTETIYLWKKGIIVGSTAR